MWSFGEFVPDDPIGLGNDGTVPNMAEKVLIIFLHGSEEENIPDLCIPKGKLSTTPLIIRSLASATVKSKEIVAFAHCTSVTPIATSGAAINAVESKVARRYQELGALLSHFTNVGYLKENIFIAGHSAGAWVALSGLAEHPKAFGGVIAFAPAFAGKPGRPPGWDKLRRLAIDGIARATVIPSLIYAFAKDEWESVEELERIFASIPGVEFIKKAGRKAKILATSPMYFHCGAYHRKFVNEERGRVLSFISQHV
jgi:dienelactone hydrolase